MSKTLEHLQILLLNIEESIYNTIITQENRFSSDSYTIEKAVSMINTENSLNTEIVTIYNEMFVEILCDQEYLMTCLV